MTWLRGPIGGPTIGDRPYEEIARAEHLSIERLATTGGLLPDFEVLASASFDPGRVDARIRDFYEDTARYRLDTGFRLTSVGTGFGGAGFYRVQRSG